MQTLTRCVYISCMEQKNPGIFLGQNGNIPVLCQNISGSNHTEQHVSSISHFNSSHSRNLEYVRKVSYEYNDRYIFLLHISKIFQENINFNE